MVYFFLIYRPWKRRMAKVRYQSKFKVFLLQIISFLVWGDTGFLFNFDFSGLKSFSNIIKIMLLCIFYFQGSLSSQKLFQLFNTNNWEKFMYTICCVNNVSGISASPNRAATVDLSHKKCAGFEQFHYERTLYGHKIWSDCAPLPWKLLGDEKGFKNFRGIKLDNEVLDPNWNDLRNPSPHPQISASRAGLKRSPWILHVKGIKAASVGSS